MIIRRILIANRGEIAVRIIRTCHELGIETVLAASAADLDSMAARLSDYTVRIGPARSDESYLNVERIMAAATAAGVDAIHPGYGFLAENYKLARACTEHKIIFIGPAEEQLIAVGDKLKARDHATAAGLPVVPGDEVTSSAEALALIDEIGCPVLVKAAGGGGGRGMNLVDDPDTLTDIINMAMSEAQAAFGDARIYLERFIKSARHVEVQLLGDGENVIHLGDRDCSIQRRYQKLIEEAPAPDLNGEIRNDILNAALAFGKHLKYRGLGTVEMLVDMERNAFYFLEMNARIQVEHPVTEVVCGIDLVAEQIAVAEGRPLRLAQDDIRITGHAVECRLNAEDWLQDFRPSPGQIETAVFPLGEGIRVDTHMQEGASVPPQYDSLLAKLIVHGKDRTEALTRMRQALARCDIGGVETNLAMHREIMQQEEYIRGGVNTAFLSGFLKDRQATGGRYD